MSILVAYRTAFKSGDVNALDAFLHEEFTFSPYVGEMVMRKADVLAFAGSGSVQTEGHRVLFENHAVRVEHATRTFPTTPHLKQFSHSTVSKMVKLSPLKPAPHHSLMILH
jgi:hypothetical protein